MHICPNPEPEVLMGQEIESFQYDTAECGESLLRYEAYDVHNLKEYCYINNTMI